MQKDCNREDTVYAGFFVRMGAYLIDLLIVAIGLCVVKFPVFCLKMSMGDSILFKNVLFSFDIFDILYYVLTVLYFTLTTYNGGQTVGKRLFCLKVVGEDGKKPDFLSILIRETVGRYLSELVIFVGYIIAGLDEQKQGLHDKIADTFVIYTAPMKKAVPPARQLQPAGGPMPQNTAWPNPMPQNGFAQPSSVPTQNNPQSTPFTQPEQMPPQRAEQPMTASTPDMVPPIPNPVPFDPAGAVSHSADVPMQEKNENEKE